jgi:hypothetical protein
MPTKCLLENLFQVDVKETGYEGVGWFLLYQDKVQWL